MAPWKAMNCSVESSELLCGKLVDFSDALMGEDIIEDLFFFERKTFSSWSNVMVDISEIVVSSWASSLKVLNDVTTIGGT